MSRYPTKRVLNDDFLSLQAQFIARVDRRLSKMQKLIVAAEHANRGDAQGLLEELHREVHKLVGAAGSYQIYAIENIAIGFEELIFKALCDDSSDDQRTNLWVQCQQQLLLLREAYESYPRYK